MTRALAGLFLLLACAPARAQGELVVAPTGLPPGWVSADELGIRCSNSGSANSDAIETAFSRMTGGLVGPEGFYVQFGMCRYSFARTINVVRHTILAGVGGSGGQASTRFFFPISTPGIVIHSHASGDLEAPAGTVNRGDWSQIRDIMIESTYNGASATVHGLEIKGHARISNVYVALFKGDCIHIRGASGDDPPTNANNWMIEYSKLDNCGGHGLYVDGADANAGVAIMVDATANGGYGFFDSSFLGNTYIACHTDSNVGGSFGADDVNARNTYIGCYVEGGQATPDFQSSRSLWLSGLNESEIVTGTALQDGWWSGFTGVKAGGINHPGISYYVQVGSRPIEGQQSYLRFWHGDDQTAALTMLYNNDDSHTYGWQYGGGGSQTLVMGASAPVIQSRSVPDGSIGFPVGVYLGSTAVRVTTGTAAPTTGTWARGDKVINSTPSAGGFAGWVCVTAGTPGTWKGYGAIEP